jgi:hypothetical protein
MFPIVMIGDLNNAMGPLMTGVPTVLSMMRPIGVMGMSMAAPHPWMGIPPKPIHPPNPVMLNCSKTVLAMMMPVAHIASVDMCLHVTIGPGNPTVLVGL